jgi:hypothetical protein
MIDRMKRRTLFETHSDLTPQRRMVRRHANGKIFFDSVFTNAFVDEYIKPMIVDLTTNAARHEASRHRHTFDPI